MKIIKETQEDVILTIEISQNQLKRLIKAAATTTHERRVRLGMLSTDSKQFSEDYKVYYSTFIEEIQNADSGSR